MNKIKNQMITQPNEDEFKKAYNYSLWLLGRREYSKLKLKRKLKEKNYADEIIEKTLLLLEEKKYQSDERYKVSKLKNLTSRGKSNKYILAKLKDERLVIQKEELTQIRETNGISEEFLIQKEIEKKIKKLEHKNLTNIEISQKVLTSLFQKGFDYDTSRDLIKQFLKELKHHDEF